MKKYNLKEDHAEIKKQIKGWEKDIDKLNKEIRLIYTLGLEKYEAQYSRCPYMELEYIHETIQHISNEMMSINI